MFRTHSPHATFAPEVDILGCIVPKSTILVALFALACGGRAAPGAESGAVRGTLVDADGRAYPGAELHLDSKTSRSDANGHFEFPDAPSSYTVSTVLPGQRVYVYSGLTRRDPTLRTDDGFSVENPSLRAQIKVTMPSADTDTIKA